MTCQELEHACDLYVFGELDAAERAELERHLARGCPVCAPAIEKSRQVLAHLALSVPRVSPPANLRSAVLESLEPRPRPAPRAVRAWQWAFAAMATASAALAMVTLDFRAQVRSLDKERTSLEKSVTDLRARQHALIGQASAYREAMQLMAAPGARQVTFGPKQPAGKIFLNPQGLVMIASDFPKPPEGRTFELWLIAQNRPAPIPAGVFEPDPRGSAFHVWRQPIAVGDIKALAVSDEPHGGVAAPTGKIHFVVPIR